MTTISASPLISSYTVFKPHNTLSIFQPISISATNCSNSSPIRLQLAISIPNSYSNSCVPHKRLNKIRFSAIEQEETVIPTEQDEQREVEPTITVPVLPSDILTMFFQAEGTMSEGAIPSVSSALQDTDGVSDLRVQVHEGIASIELKKKTTVQATGVASNLVEIIQNSGFKLQALNLSFEDENAN